MNSHLFEIFFEPTEITTGWTQQSDAAVRGNGTWDTIYIYSCHSTHDNGSTTEETQKVGLCELHHEGAVKSVHRSDLF